MPYLRTSTYKAPFWLPGGHAQTMFPVLLRKVTDLFFARRRIATPDEDVIDLDFFTVGMSSGCGAAVSSAALAERGVVVLSHGLEGNSHRKYMRGMCLAFARAGFDCVARNFRGCSGEMNRLPGMYHSGQTEDVHTVVEYCRSLGYRRIFLVGFSMGGNQTLKYLGENPGRVPPEVAGAAVFSVPCDLTSSALELERSANQIYMRYFLRTLCEKVREKHRAFPEAYPLEGLENIRGFTEFDGRYTAPVHGFASARDYWEKSSCLPFLSRIDRPTLLVNARNDPFLSPSCFPEREAEKSRFLTLETPAEGGHVGFVPDGRHGEGIFPGERAQGGHTLREVYWSEARAVAFVTGIS